MRYDAIVVGAGQSGPSLAGFFAGQGQHVALAEGGVFGGSCVNYGCTPTKTIRASARLVYQARRAAEFGIQTGEVSVDFSAVMARKDRVVGKVRDGLVDWLEGISGVDLYRHYARFIGVQDGIYQMQVGDDVLEAERVYLNVGTRSYTPPITGLDQVNYLDNVRLMGLETLPAHLLILGGGYIGLEMGQIFRRLGSAVTIVENSARVAVNEDEDVTAEIERILRAEGVTIYTGHQAVAVSQAEDGTISLIIKNGEGQTRTLEGSHFLVATGRQPNTDSLNLQAIGLETDKRGYIKTNGQLETALKGIYAVGDINGRGAFTHTSYHDYEIVRDNWLGEQRSADDRIMVYSMFTDPPMGRVGMSERTARASGRNILVMKHEAKNVSRAKEEDELNGLVKIIVDADTEQILGACTFIMQGDDVVQVVSNFMATGASYRVMRNTLPIHPTISEFFPTWLSMLKPAE